MKEVTYSKQAIKTLSRIPANESARVRSKVRQYADNPASQMNNVRKLQGRDAYRLRVGDWRIIFGEDEVVIDVIKIGARGSVYED